MTKFPWIIDGKWELYVERSSFSELQDDPAIRIQSKREGLAFKDTRSTEWWKGLIDGEIVTAGGLIYPNATTARLKSGIILPEWRGCGIYWPLVRVRLERALELGCEKVTGYTGVWYIYKRYGFNKLGERTSKNNPSIPISLDASDIRALLDSRPSRSD